ncbi:YeeE/YedE thiosulfate transporter family protein [Methanoregula sp.]|uniref:YeeE/YedE thiosulfate transporter family protein n=1 Tax=Methanoregula sp. TaxID=2052170 RepID=UPI002BCEFCE2|nr:YeeE/YedE thiosulfate transporter family protein [Methanoregula sp.]HVP96190.1 YeeE/YedE thiosulfate transporter family protein [Methanoregula sp.]
MPLCTRIHHDGRAQLIFGLLVGILFGFFLQKGGVTSYDVIIGQLLLENFTVVKVMLSAVIVAMIGVHLLVRYGYAELHVYPGSWGSNLIGGIIFGIGFALLGLCPGTVIGAAGTGALDALIGGILGLLVGSGLFANLYPRIKPILCQGPFSAQTLPELLHLNRWVVIVIVEACMVGILLLLAGIGL